MDFDGTVVEHQYPAIGPDVPHAVDCLRTLAFEGHKLILFTMRSGPELEQAVAWYRRNKIPLYSVNENPEQFTWTTSPKAYADLYIDDLALGCR